ncbi:MAG: hypothetical protein MJZ93_07105 [Paludibacteraceae bacterium]|nr:hypothetical protein [Paludibacteraceae bacterium]
MRKTITLLFLLACCMASAQKGPKIVPNWVLKTPIPGNDTYYYIMQRANGSSEREARNQAIAQAFAQADYYGGTAVNSESINEAIQEGKSFDVISRLFSIPLNIVCEFHRDNEDGTVDYYILCQIAKSGNIKPQFEPFNECSEFDISIQRMEEYREKHAAEFKAKEREEAKRAREDRLKDNDYINNGRNKYVAWGVVGANYPWSVNSSIEFRYGNTVGFGLYGELGVGVSKLDIKAIHHPDSAVRLPQDKLQDKIFGFFSYSAGIKFFPYRGLFIGCGYGSYLKYPLKIECPDENTSKQNKDYCKDAMRNPNSGVQCLLGYDFVNKMEHNYSFYLGVKGGIIYDIKNKSVIPLAGLKLGVAFGYK